MSNPVKHADLENVKAVAGRMDALRNQLSEARAHLERVRKLNGQNGYSVQIADRWIRVATMDMKTYNAVLVRGMEMIHLGALKALGAEISDLEAKLRIASAALAKAAIAAGEQA